MAPSAEINFKIEEPIEGLGLRAVFTALPATDPNDSEQVLCYRSYFPTPNASI